jgi:hypothetical protein
MGKCAVLAAALALAAWAAGARADDWEVEHPYILFNPKTPHPVLRLFHCQPPLLAWQTHNEFGCGSALSDGTFVWGSCRAYYSEPILKAPPPPPWSPEADMPPTAVEPPPSWRLFQP